MDHKIILESKRAYGQGVNIIDFVSSTHQVAKSQIIELAYDLQAGTYIADFHRNESNKRKYTNECGDILSRYISENHSILNIGAGELWTISLILERMSIKPRNIFNLEISWSRIYEGCSFWRQIHNDSIDMQPIVADMAEIPFPSNAVDIVTSSHALEPNGDQIERIVSELFRVSRDKCILFEPCYELCSKKGRERMDKLGYIKGLDKTIHKLGGHLEEIIPISNIANDLNPTACFVIKVPTKKTDYNNPCFTVPGSEYILHKQGEWYYSNETSLAFPILKNIPIFRSQKAVLASKF